MLSRRAVLLAVALSLAASAAAQAPAAVDLRLDPDAAALAVHDLVNATRTKGGECGGRWVDPRHELRWANDLAELAASWASDPRVVVRQDGKAVAFTHGDLRDRAGSYRVRAENIAGTVGSRPSPPSAVRQWLEAPGHCTVLRSRVPNETGVAVGRHDLNERTPLWVFVQVFR